MYSNNKLLQHILFLLKANNIRKIVISPGSRHFPLSHSIENDPFFQPFSVVDERSAAFFALGLIQESNEPVAICCSSGTSVANYGSAVSEAFYQKLPLLLLTADRVPELLGQKEDQMMRQDNMFHEFIKYHGQLPLIKTDLDEWYANRIINEALIELNHTGAGPVQLNYPIFEHKSDTFQLTELPVVRKITCHKADEDPEIWSQFRKKLTGKKIMMVWGQSVKYTERLDKALNKFCEMYNCVIITDRISNCLHPNAILNSFVVLKAMTLNEQAELSPDVVLTLGGNIIFNSEIKDYLNRNASHMDNWQIGPENVVCDAFHKLTEMFEMNEAAFFEIMTAENSKATDNSYFDRWNEISETITKPEVEFSQVYSIGKLINQLPQNSVLQLSNSSAIRIGHLFDIDESIKCYCNRGVNGIDGCMSTAVGYAATSEQPVFLIIGDLTFFYDMNALWNRHLSKNIRILLVNNQGGAVMHLPFGNDMGPVLVQHTSAGHITSAKGWVESIGMKYISATDKESVDNGIEMLIDMKIDGPVLLEVFTTIDEDAAVYKKYMAEINRVTLADKAKRKAGKILNNFFKR
ncbi:MAG: 2-succinyl-5-enolpyruvyl-6-hydroxy-3-cyclohexene-1-carboxylic-acid synthase [Paludibacter sp.]|nr:2-succinyl-5-enolpyruvyl-6-hydroxy-3-cyclohexene-1-carboxylic-acid synthase [Paludibacter sp.]